ncbi:MAG: hypothetical protein L0Y60_13390 [Beijerinckiaceae bacterium]|nr:hypothetical protein [Beijerinckiaceae bacterium]
MPASLPLTISLPASLEWGAREFAWTCYAMGWSLMDAMAGMSVAVKPFSSAAR